MALDKWVRFRQTRDHIADKYVFLRKKKDICEEFVRQMFLR